MTVRVADQVIKRLPQKIKRGLDPKMGHHRASKEDHFTNQKRMVNLYRPERVRLAPQRRIK
jgi:hypothetical protein